MQIPNAIIAGLLPIIASIQLSGHIHRAFSDINEQITKHITMTTRPATKTSNKEKVTEMYRLLNARDWNALERIVSNEFKGPDGTTGAEGFIRPIKQLTKAFTDAHWQTKEIMEEGDKVIVIQELTGTHTGLFQQYAATGKKITNSGIAVYYFTDGLIARSLLQNDRLGFLQQLGILPQDLQSLSKKTGKDEQ
jgi:predicted ester cyclase